MIFKVNTNSQFFLRIIFIKILIIIIIRRLSYYISSGYLGMME